MKTRSRFVLGAALAGVAGFGFLSTAAHAAVLYSTGFSSPTYSDGALIMPPTATDTTTTGQDNWLSTSAGLTNNIAVQNSATNGFVAMTTSGQDVRRLFDSAATVTSGSVFYDADVTLSAAQATGDYFMHFSDGGTSNFYGRLFAKSSGAGFVLALNTASGTPQNYGSTVLNFNQSYHFLVRYDFVAGLANDTGALFVDPTSMDGTADTAYVAATTSGTDATTIAALGLRQGTAGSAATISNLDNYRAFTVDSGTTPEPASLALVGMAGLGLLSRRRK